MNGRDGAVYRVHLADPGGRVTIREVPTGEFEPTDRGIVMRSAMVVPWHRVLRYTREVAQPLDDPGLPSHTEIRAWVDDGSPTGETLLVRSDRFEPSPWTANFLIEGTMNVETATLHLTKVHVPWGRVLEYERISERADAFAEIRPD